MPQLLTLRTHQLGLVSQIAILAYSHEEKLTNIILFEHIFELQTPSRLIEFMVHGILPKVVTGGVTIPEYRTQRTLMDPDILAEYFQKPYHTWDRATEGLRGRTDADLMHCLGAKDNTKNIRLMDAAGNALKSRVILNSQFLIIALTNLNEI